MATISVPLTPALELFIKDEIARGNADNKAQVVRRALHQAAKDAAVTRVLEARAEVSRGESMLGTLDEIFG